jgi:hypothetical protein
MHKSAMKCNKTLGKWYKNKHGASKIIDTFETYQRPPWRGSPQHPATTLIGCSVVLGQGLQTLAVGRPRSKRWSWMGIAGIDDPESPYISAQGHRTCVGRPCSPAILASVLQRKSTVKLDFEQCKSMTDLHRTRHRHPVIEECAVSRSRGEITAGSLLPGERIRPCSLLVLLMETPPRWILHTMSLSPQYNDSFLHKLSSRILPKSQL